LLCNPFTATYGLITSGAGAGSGVGAGFGTGAFLVVGLTFVPLTSIIWSAGSGPFIA
jgi:hypothetical protein